MKKEENVGKLVQVSCCRSIAIDNLLKAIKSKGYDMDDENILVIQNWINQNRFFPEYDKIFFTPNTEYIELSYNPYEGQLIENDSVYIRITTRPVKIASEDEEKYEFINEPPPKLYFKYEVSKRDVKRLIFL